MVCGLDSESTGRKRRAAPRGALTGWRNLATTPRGAQWWPSDRPNRAWGIVARPGGYRTLGSFCEKKLDAEAGRGIVKGCRRVGGKKGDER